MTSSRKLLITGGTGFIGSHTVVEVMNAGFDVVIVDDLSNSRISVLDGIEKITGKRPLFEQFNLCDKDKVIAFFKKHNDILASIHFAASKSVGESVKFPLKYYRNNLLSLINLLEAQIEYNVEFIVFSSSCTVYGQPDVLPVTEEAPVQKAESPYGNTKKICEEILRDFTRANANMKAIALRYFNPIGAHDSGLIGELPQGTPENLVPYITQTAVGVREQLKVNGNDYNTPDGTCLRDYLHVVDLAKAHLVAVSRMLENRSKAHYEFFNLGTGIPYSVLEAIQSFEKVSGCKLNYRIGSRRSGDIEKIWADTSFANRELGWKAERDLDDMMRSAWKWETNYRSRNK
jgi:UDP-glucose 4-epimerase